MQLAYISVIFSLSIYGRASLTNAPPISKSVGAKVAPSQKLYGFRVLINKPCLSQGPHMIFHKSPSKLNLK